MNQVGKLFRDKPLKVLACTIIAGYSGQAFTADNGHDSTKEQTIVVTAAAPSQGQDDESSLVAHNATAGTKSSQPISRTSQSIAVVTQAQIAAQAAKTIPEALRYVSGVASENAGPDTRFDTIVVRGFEADEYLDGLRLPREAWWSRPAWDPFLLSRIEVVKGPSSVLYGQANPGGVVNMVSKTPQAQPGGEVYMSTGNNNLFGTGFDVTGPLTDDNTLLGRVAGTFFDTETQVDHTRYQHYDIAPSFTWQPSDRTSLTVLAQLRKDPDSGFYNQMPTSGTLTYNPNGQISSKFYGGQPGFDSYERKQGSIGYQFRHDFNDTVTFRQNLRYISSTGDYLMVYPWGVHADAPLIDRYSMNLQETMVNFAVDNQAEFHLQTGPVQHTLLAGIDRMHSSVRSRAGYGDASPINYLNPDYSTPVEVPAFTSSTHSTLDQTGFYLQDQLEWANWIMNLAGRYDAAKTKSTNLLTDARTESNDYATTGRAGLLYHFDNGLAPYVSYSTSFVPSSTTDFYGHGFKPTEGKQTEMGLKYDPVGLDALFTLALFNLRETNVATPDPDHANYSVQTGEIRSRGIELDGKINITPAWSVLASYALTDPEVISANDGTEGKHPVGIARNSAKLWTQYALSGPLDGFSIGGGVRYVGSSYANTDNSLKVPAATVYDARLGYDWHEWGVALNAANLTNKTYLATCQNNGCEYAMKRQLTATVSYKW
ncbi:TonB-dependent siderophore receptor [Kluyvera ascorbata]|uniref:TonB-dependent siderophore receptor n=1 Tax=Kluyvera ascorbata TaxID=51288 RepID=UPI0022E82CD8|nr:TonB-dependent siderophore receptor [Kluyvera ascorbata]HDG1679269.1 TonB-dependent siderophore receptor [Kluyvera ascorbata]